MADRLLDAPAALGRSMYQELRRLAHHDSAESAQVTRCSQRGERSVSTSSHAHERTVRALGPHQGGVRRGGRSRIERTHVVCRPCVRRQRRPQAGGRSAARAHLSRRANVRRSRRAGRARCSDRPDGRDVSDRRAHRRRRHGRGLHGRRHEARSAGRAEAAAAASAADADRLRRFHAEARAVSSLNHPHILVIHDFGEIDGPAVHRHGVVEGETLRQRLERGRAACARRWRSRCRWRARSRRRTRAASSTATSSRRTS